MPANTPQDRAVIEAQLGPRGATPITSANRQLARQWVAAMGWGRAFADILTLKELTIAYNNRDKGGVRGKDLHLEKRLAAFENRMGGGLFQGNGNPPAGAG